MQFTPVSFFDKALTSKFLKTIIAFISSFKRGVFMECIKCKNEMTKAKFLSFGGFQIESETKSIFETPERSSVEVYVCNKCGYVEFKATDYKKF